MRACLQKFLCVDWHLNRVVICDGYRDSLQGWARGVVDALAPGTSLLRSFLQHADSVSVMASRKSLLLFSGLMKKAIVIRTP